MNGVFVDTAGLFAALVRNDINHEDAAATLDRLLEREVELYCSNYVLLEALALLQHRVGLEAARQVEHELRPLLHVSWIDEPSHRRAFRRLELRGRRSLSLVDCSSFVVMEEVGLRHVFTYDSDFADEGFTCVGTADQADAAAGP